MAPGVSLEDVYRAGEREELKLQRQGGRLRDKAESTLDAFASRGPGAAYSDFAAAAMDRVRARLTGYDDDRGAGGEEEEEGGDAASSSGRTDGDESGRAAGANNPAARRVLRALVTRCGCRGERAEAIAEACVPPGLMVDEAAGDGTAIGGGASRQLWSGRVCTTPQGLLEVIAAERQRLAGDGGGGQQPVLETGESVAQVLSELEEDVGEYNTHVYSRLSPLERFGGGGGGF